MASLTRLKRLTVLHFTYDVLIQVDKSLLDTYAPNQSTVLAWIKKPLAQLKRFVRNRAFIIQKLTESDFWKHVNSENNPVDILSRGNSPDKIQHCELWWFVPPFLHLYNELEPYDITAIEGDDLFLQELKETSDFPLCALLKNFEPLDIISNFSSFTKLQRVIAWCKRFIENARHPMCRAMGPLKSAENTLANIRNSFWISSARNVVRKILRTCMIPVRRRMPLIGGYHPYGLTSILTGLESNRACVGYAWPMNCSPSTPSQVSNELRRALLDEWCNIPQDQIDDLILSMPRRCKVCIALSGRHTPY
ncbi:uncharacterized protein TNCV_4579421 [Trichonephila clavipes]|nr:uncharacterized protein TNCV_4579421 [Trichonephila clavipes]